MIPVSSYGKLGLVKVLTFFSFLIFFSCSVSHNRTGKYIDFEEEGMICNYAYCFDSIISNDWMKKDLGKVEISVNVRYTEAFPFLKLPLNIEETSLNSDSIHNYFFEIPLFNSSGYPINNKKHGLYEVTHVVSSNIEVDSTYTIWISTPLEHSEGIKSLGVFIREIPS